VPRGFSGRLATVYLTEASTAHSRALSSGQQISDGAPSTASLRSRSLPFAPEEGATSSLVPTGRGNSSNIVVSQREYETVTRLISQADDRLGECIYNIANEIEALCQTAFILPDAVPRCLNISDSVKQSLGEFRGMTEDAIQEVRSFARRIGDVG